MPSQLADQGDKSMRPREFLALLVVSGVVAWPLAPRMQLASIPAIGLLGSASTGTFPTFLAAFPLLIAAGEVDE